MSDPGNMNSEQFRVARNALIDAQPWCSNCNDDHSIEESCSDNAKRYESAWNDGMNEHDQLRALTIEQRSLLTWLAESHPEVYAEWRRIMVAAVSLTGGSDASAPEATAGNAPSPTGDTNG